MGPYSLTGIRLALLFPTSSRSTKPHHVGPPLIRTPVATFTFFSWSPWVNGRAKQSGGISCRREQHGRVLLLYSLQRAGAGSSFRSHNVRAPNPRADAASRTLQ